MKKWGIFLFLAISILLGGSYFIFFQKKGAGILVESSPGAVVFVGEEQVGRTPYEGNFPPGEVIIKLVPESGEPLAPYEVKVNLEPGIKTVIGRQFGATASESSGEIISFDKVVQNETVISVVSNPDSAQVMLDGQVQGFTPLKMSAIFPGEHQLVISAKGYQERTFTIRAVEGYRLTAVVDLAERAEEIEEIPPEKEPVQKIKILETGTGFLRVRAEPTTAAAEVGQVKPGEEYELLQESADGAWYQIQFGAGQGWISKDYAD